MLETQLQIPPTLRARRRDFISILHAALHVGFVIAPLALAVATPLGWGHLLLWIWFGVSAHGLVLMLHETAHYSLFKRKSWCRFWGVWILGPFFFSDFEVYRQRHWIHHRETGGAGDTKLTYRQSIQGWRGALCFVRALFLVDALRGVYRQLFQLRELSAPSGSAQSVAKVRIAPLLLMQLCLMLVFLGGAFLASGDIQEAIIRAVFAYAFVYAYGIASLTVLVATFRSIAEHKRIGIVGAPVQEAALRNMKASAIDRLIWGAYGFVEHATHHLDPTIPSYQLAAATDVARRQNPQLEPTITYWEAILRANGMRREAPWAD